MTKFGPSVGESIAKALRDGIATEGPRRNAPVTNSRPRTRDAGSVRAKKESAAAKKMSILADSDNELLRFAHYVCFTLSCEVPSLKNERYWQRRFRVTKQQRELVAAHLAPYPDSTRQALSLGCVVTLTRVSPRKLDDDNLRPALSAFRDAVAVWMYGGRVGQRDDDERMEVEYGQITGPVRGVVVSIRGTT